MALEFMNVGKRLSNWGRWGKDDRIGTLNHITPEWVAVGAALVKRGQSFDLGLTVGALGPQTGAGGRINPVHLMSMTSLDFPGRKDGLVINDDYIFMPLQSVTQWDGLGHVGYEGSFYNGVPITNVNTAVGSPILSIDQLATKGVAGRGVLLDIARLRGVERLASQEPITPADLTKAEEKQSVKVGPGDILLVRTGWIRNFTVDGSAANYWMGEPGLTLECAEWLHQRDVAAVASDNWGVEVMAPITGEWAFPLHCVLIRDMGMTLGEIFVLEELAEDCAKDGRWSFFFCAPPLKVVGGVGSPITPLAFK